MIARLQERFGAGPRPLVVNLSIGLLCLIWGSTWLVIREGLADLPPLTALAARFLLAGAVLSALAPTLSRIEGGARPSLRLTLVHAVLCLAVPYALIYRAETVLPSGLVSVLWSICPMLTAVCASILLPEERLAPRQWLGLLGGFLGVALMFATDVRAVGPDAIPVGLLLLGSPAVSALGTNLVKRDGAGTSSALLNRNGMLLGGALVAAWAFHRESGASVTWSPRAIASVAYLALVGTVLAFTVYFWLLRHAPVTRLSLIAYGIPVVALTLGGTLGDEPVGLHTVGGMLLVLLGIGVVMAGRARTTVGPVASTRPVR